VKMVILAGGLGSRLSEETTLRPKPMVEIGDRPIVWHLMKNASMQGVNDFVLALGYKGEVIKRFFADYHLLRGSLSVDLESGHSSFDAELRERWKVQLVDTGLHTLTGGRLKQLSTFVVDGPFLATYGDGLADVDLSALLAFHRSHGKLATVTAVRPPARFGGLRFEGDRVAEFVEKPQVGEGWINGGFFVLERAALEYVSGAGDDVSWERDPLEALARDGQLYAYRHPGFFQPMDTMRDKLLLEELWRAGTAPWRNW
jgi:glucose-1-phosphate cytidylyltransferase